jgi:hypothetical protein
MPLSVRLTRRRLGHRVECAITVLVFRAILDELSAGQATDLVRMAIRLRMGERTVEVRVTIPALTTQPEARLGPSERCGCCGE